MLRLSEATDQTDLWAAVVANGGDVEVAILINLGGRIEAKIEGTACNHVALDTGVEGTRLRRPPRQHILVNAAWLNR
ncbi:hypothetical protein D3C80_2098020 [compost metagenome]